MDHGSVLIGSGCSLLGVEDSRSRFGCLGSGPPRNSTPLAGDELFGNSLGGSVGASLFNLFPSGQSRDAHNLAVINTDSRDCTSLLNSSNSRSNSNSDVQILPPTAGQVDASELESTETSLFPGDSASQPAADMKTPIVASSRKKSSERIAANGEAKEAGKDGGKDGKGSRNSPDNERRLQGTWTAEENVKFFNALRAHARSFDKIHDEMGATKTREQVRCYYYRVIKKINQIISYTGTKIDKGSNSEGNGVIEAILCWWDLMKKGTSEDTSVNLFRNSANLSDEERMTFAERLWSKSATKSNGKHPLECAKSDARSSVAQRIEFDGPAARGNALPKSGVMPGKILEKVELKTEARAVHASTDRTPKRDIPAGKSKSSYLSPPAGKLPGETPLRDERVLIQSPKGHSVSDGSLHASPNNTSPLSFQIGADSEMGADSADRLKLRLLARNPELGALIKKCGYNPQLELTFKPTKAIGSIAARLGEKWGGKLAELLADEGGAVHKSWRVGGWEKKDVVFRLFMAKEEEQDAHPGWGPHDRSVQARQVHSFMGNPSRFNLFYSLDEQDESEQRSTHTHGDLDEDDASQHSGLRHGKLVPFDQDSSSSSNDFVPFQRHLARIDGFQDPASSSPQKEKTDRSEFKGSPSRHPPGGIDFAKVAPKTAASASGVPWTEDDVLFSSMLASRDGMGYTHSNMGSLTFPGDSLDGLNVLLNPDESSLGAVLGAGMSSRQATSSAAPAVGVAETEQGAAKTTPTVFKADAVVKDEPTEAMKVEALDEDAASKSTGEKRTATEAAASASTGPAFKRVKQSATATSVASPLATSPAATVKKE